MNAPADPLRIDIISDVVCPWCIIGYEQLVRALDVTDTPHTIHWHPFELNPSMPAQGQNLREHIVEKYGTTPEQSMQARAEMTRLGADLGFEFRFTDDMRMHNTFNVHQLLHWAETQGRQHELKLSLFGAHFTQGQDLSDDDVLADIAAGIGLNRAEALAALHDQRFAAEVRAAEQAWTSRGISGVPAVIFNQRNLVSGAQGVDNFTQILLQLTGRSTAAES